METAEQYYDRLIEEGYGHDSARKMVVEAEMFGDMLRSLGLKDDGEATTPKESDAE